MTRRLAVRIELPGPWVEVDPADPFPGRELAPVREAFASVGFRFASAPPGGRFCLGAALWEPPLPEFAGEPPLIASVVITEHANRTAVPVRKADGNAIVPVRAVERRTYPWPTPDIEAIEALQVSYLVPSPDGSTTFVAVFSTPNLPLQDDMEFLFDSIMATMSWVDEAADASLASSVD